MDETEPSTSSSDFSDMADKILPVESSELLERTMR